MEVLWQNDGSSEYGTGQWTSPGLVAAGFDKIFVEEVQ
jgi:hypothetical protein